MNNISTAEVTPKQPGALRSFDIMSGMLFIGFVTALFGLWLLLPEKANGSGFGVPKKIVLPLVVASTVFLLKLIPGDVRGNLQRQYKIFGNMRRGRASCH